jgi:hypothetical protein
MDAAAAAGAGVPESRTDSPTRGWLSPQLSLACRARLFVTGRGIFPIMLQEHTMSKVMFNIQWEGQAPTLAQVRKKLSLKTADLDESFGVVAVDPKNNTYTILVEHAAIVKLTKSKAPGVSGPYANPKIGPFDLPGT